MSLQSVRPKSGVFCFLINEARETTALEMPDYENTFVLKVPIDQLSETVGSKSLKSNLAALLHCFFLASLIVCGTFIR